jgi:hypothetical protein
MCKSKLNRRLVKLDEFKYIFEGKVDFENHFFDEGDNNTKKVKSVKNDILKKNIKSILYLIENTNIKNPITNIKFILDKNIILQNNCEYNNDHRGLNHMIINLPFESNIKLPKEFTLENLVTSLYNLKSHKFDYWYELFCDTNVKVKDNEVIVNLNFDHGS